MPDTPARRRRGGQPGNKNAQGNRGNRHARGTPRNRGGRGAPCGNQFARRRRTLDAELLSEFGRSAEAVSWIEANRERLRAIDVTDDSRLSFSVSVGLTPEALAGKGREYRYGLYHEPSGGGLGLGE